MAGLLLLRADGDGRIGSGHVMRCLALAQAWQDADGQAAFVMTTGSADALEARVKAEGMACHRIEAQAGTADDLRLTMEIARELRADWLVVDGYAFDAKYQRGVKETGRRLLVFDDYGHAEQYCADYVLNQNLGAQESLYARREPGTRLLLGPRYAQLRREFKPWREWRREIPARARRVLVTLGGADPENATGKVVQALSAPVLAEVEAVVIVGGSNPRCEALRQQAAQAGVKARFERDATRMAEWMAWADVAVSGAGSTCWEMAFMGLPALVFVLAENQRAIARQLEKAGVSLNLGPQGDATAEPIAAKLGELLAKVEQRETMSRRARALVDGRGGERVCLAMKACDIRFRPATERDSRLVWEWANAPEVRAVSFSRKPIPWESHVEWFASRLRNPACRFWLASMSGGEPFAQVRFEPAEASDTMVMSVSLDGKHRGKGLGPQVIWAASQKLFAEGAARRIEALVKVDNTASCRAFEKADFHRAGERVIQGQPAFVYESNCGPATK
jgi:UDP-2,4-diacetamido-2,4,6-trideoxy-beta-L-altropyranose hydrolase